MSFRGVLLHLSIPPSRGSMHLAIHSFLSIQSIYYSIFSICSISSVFTFYLFFLLFYLCGGFGRFRVQWWGLNSTQTLALAGFGLGLGGFGFGGSQAQFLNRFWAQWWSLNFIPDPGFGRVDLGLISILSSLFFPFNFLGLRVQLICCNSSPLF